MKNKLGVFPALVIIGFLIRGAVLADEDGAGSQPFNPFEKETAPELDGDADTRADGESPPKSPYRVSARISDESTEFEDEPGFSWPKFPKPRLPSIAMPTLPKIGLPAWFSEKEMKPHPPHDSGEPSTWQKFSSGSKDFFSRTKQTLMPWSDEGGGAPARRSATPPRRSASKSAARIKGKNASSEKKSFLPWFSRREEPRQPKTPSEFLAQPRVE